MDLNHTLHKSKKNAELHSTTNTRLCGYKLVLARTMWLTLICLILIVFFLGIPEAFKLVLSIRPETVAGLKHLGLPASFPAIYTITLDTAIILVFACFALLSPNAITAMWTTVISSIF